MRCGRPLVALLLTTSTFLFIATGCKTNAPASLLAEGCYDPLAGHPTDAEKIAFIKQIIPYAQDAERMHGIPAAGIMPMATQEGGYGFTKTARFAQNLFGYKNYGSESSGGRGYWVLQCQPSWDPNNKYVKFKSLAEGFDFVAMKLATLKSLSNGKRNYQAVTQRYIQDRKNGVDVTVAVNRWIDGISDAGYNYNPSAYKKSIKAFAANLEKPKNGYSPQYNSYQYSASVMPLSGKSPPPPPPPAPPPSSPPAKISYNVEGVVHMIGNEDNRLANAYIDFNGKTIATQDTGYFILEDLAPGRYEFVAKMEGFNDRRVTVDIKDKSLEIYVGLSPK